jgi:hypothetical protein
MSGASVVPVALVTKVGVSNRCVVIILKDQKIMRKFTTEKSRMVVQLTAASEFRDNLSVPLSSKVNRDAGGASHF